jgi:hypothetical protein
MGRPRGWFRTRLASGEMAVAILPDNLVRHNDVLELL